MKLFIGFSVIFILLVIVAFFIGSVSVSYEETSNESIEEYNRVMDLIAEIKCPSDGVSKAFVFDLKKQYPEMLFAMKGEDLLIDGFQFACVLDKASVAWVKRGTNVTRDEQGTELKSRYKLHH